MRREHRYWVYIMGNTAGRTSTLYIGVTNDLPRRVMQHRARRGSKFAATYRLHRLVYCEEYRYIDEAIRREKQLKGWRRDRKIALIEETNPRWEDLAAEWGPADAATADAALHE